MTGKIFINYRRGDDPGFAGRLFDKLEERFGRDQLFMDIDSIPAGEDYIKVLEDQVAQCAILLAVIGRGWLEAKEANGVRRLDNIKDFVRVEIESGLRLGKRVIPVLVNGAAMPEAEALPEPLRPLASRNAIRLTHDRFRVDVQSLIKVVEDAIHQASVETKRRADEETARAEEATREERERLRLLAKKEELTNWDFIKESTSVQEFRDHLARKIHQA